MLEKLMLTFIQKSTLKRSSREATSGSGNVD